jgi:hypothetical protein
MIFVLPTLCLSLAIASDTEVESEQAWAERFEAIDRNRAELEIPPLMAKERMGLLLGKWPNPDFYYIDVHEFPRRQDRFRMALYRHGKKERDLPLKNQEHGFEAGQEAIALAKSLYISWGPDPA